ncbi:unnamed protein product [Mytilus coruscus]|uniref:Uncharacterized protein n=1 Tax=Mytilus coruscus TaxID=42192 RepID=A0A6J8E127_MYTCO|nr:unnamed protein product [Mytilus coruscus]
MTSNIVISNKCYSEWEMQNPGTLSDVLGEPSRAKTSKTSTSAIASSSLIQGRVFSPTGDPFLKKGATRHLEEFLGPQKITSKKFTFPKMQANTMPASTATIVAPPLASSFLVPRVIETDSDESSMSNPTSLLISSSPMDVECITTTTSRTTPIPPQVVRLAATSGLMLVERRIVG